MSRIFNADFTDFTIDEMKMEYVPHLGKTGNARYGSERSIAAGMTSKILSAFCMNQTQSGVSQGMLLFVTI
jgi:hypothetical protein